MPSPGGAPERGAAVGSAGWPAGGPAAVRPARLVATSPEARSPSPATPPQTQPDGAEEAALTALDRGDREAALALLMDAYGGVLYRYCLHVVADPQLAEDVHQTTFVQAFEGMGRFARGSSLRTWLFGIARHRCLDALKTTRRRRARFRVVEALPDHPAGEAGPEDRLLARVRALALARCLGRLSSASRSAVLLRYQAGLSYAEMASAGGERATTLQARVARALPVLRRCLERREGRR